MKIFRCHSYMTLKQWKKRSKGCFHVTFIEPHSKSGAGHRETQMNKAFSVPFNNSYSRQGHRHASIYYGMKTLQYWYILNIDVKYHGISFDSGHQEGLNGDVM